MNLRAALLDILAVMYVTCHMFWYFVKILVKHIMISAFKTSTFLKHEILRLQTKSLISGQA